ncbi:MAG: 3-deoxy-7-phosphoheptulonate synthase [Dehalococcoidia bacterium]|nr:Phospho-2-dehydro-3-deoxyheptonate aldolase [Chloroflexota bacterium]MBT9159281.1 Phospho-2-dehydro-3-deoxyheptonate aldolase [Chloroflexota bacterium]MBT9162913.1 Phospho-2-dehydro-3-deoxyheptonate aldolase [Chloroflexota bacterium]
MTIKVEESNQTRSWACPEIVVAGLGQKLLFASREHKSAGTAVDIGGVKVGLLEVVVMAGPCSVESAGQILRIAQEVKQAGATILRGGAFKPRTSPYDFQGLGRVGLEYLRAASSETGLRVVTEVVDPRDVELVCEYADCLQIGSRNMQNYSLLREVGRSSRPVLLKRGMSASYREFLLAAEYIMAEGNDQVALCERGIISLSKELRFTLDLNAVPYLKAMTHLPVIVDPSHGTGSAPLVAAMSRAAIACGADGLILETHYSPEDSISDAAQTISTGEFARLMKVLAAVADAVGRKISLTLSP